MTGWLDDVRVIAITDRTMMGNSPAEFGDAIERAVQGCPPGSVLVQVREKDLDGGRLLELISIARRYSRVIVNDRVDVAIASEAIAVHLPEDGGLTVAEARAQFPGVIGVSRHAPDADTGADLVHLGPIWETPSKLGRPALGTAVLKAPHGSAKLVAVGGIDSPERAREAVAAGADAIAVIRAAWSGDSLVPFVTAVDAGRALRS
ncbi:MAG: thiamine phosphate synthase [Myxococcales bacterium]|nr:thiamine phosphate synthase [Myxococcales bacterium]